MGDVNVRRSQAILRMPVDMVDAVMILHDGDRSDIILFVPPAESVWHVVWSGRAFVPVMREASTCLVACDAIACLGVAADRAPSPDLDPTIAQPAKVTLRNGMVLEGVMHWIAPEGSQRTIDYLNCEVTFLVLHTEERVWLIAKSHIAMVREL